MTGWAPTAFLRMVEVLLPRGGWVFVLVEAYFDESIGTAKEPDGRTIPVLCVAGYLIKSEEAAALCEDWRAVLEPYGLPYFHMVDCAHGSGVYEHILKPQRIQIASRMIGNIKRRTIRGLSVAVNLNQWNAVVPKHPMLGSAYTHCMNVIMAGVAAWADIVGFGGEIAYFFEAGHASRGETDEIMRQTFAIPDLKASARYAGHAFLEKAKCPPVQAADLLAWQFYTDVRHQLEGTRPRRKDFASLLEHPHTAKYLLPNDLQALANEPGFGAASADLLAAFKAAGGKLPKLTGEPATPSYERRSQS